MVENAILVNMDIDKVQMDIAINVLMLKLVIINALQETLLLKQLVKFVKLAKFIQM